MYRYHFHMLFTLITLDIDIDECEGNSHQCEDVNGCINSNGTYYCQCTNDNEKLASKGYRCLSKY